MAQPVLEVTNLTKRFGPAKAGFTAVDNISFSVAEGEIVGLLGRNGAGKTTTISMLLGLLTPTKGTITVLGRDFLRHRVDILRQVNFSSAYINFPSVLSARENLKVFAYLYDIADRNKRVEEVIELFDIRAFADTRYLYLSSGQQARVHLAKAFLNRPRILFLDEPTSSLDPDVADTVRALIVSTQKQYRMSVLLTSHNLAEVEEMCDRVLLIDRGRLIAEDTPEDLAKQIKQILVRLMIKDGMKRTLTYCQENAFQVRQEGRYLTVDLTEEEIVYFLTFLAERGIEYQEISIERPTLEDWFLEEVRK